MDHISPKSKTSFKLMSFSSTAENPRASFYLLITFSTFLILLQLQAIKNPFPSSSSSSSWPFSNNHQACMEANCTNITFLPLKDLRFAVTAMEGHTWFMSSLNDTYEKCEAEHLHFPSEASGGQLLCLSGRNHSDGTANTYALARREALPQGARLLGGLTFVSDTYYDYDNLWHGLSAMMPFMAWHQRKHCVRPARWILYHRGELRTSMSTWVRTLTETVFGEVNIEEFSGGDEPRCFEEAVVFRHNEGAMARARKEEVYDMMRCKARAYCGIRREVEDLKAVRMTLFLRTGARSFKDESAMIGIFGKECMNMEGCRLMVARPNNLTFCDQVKLMTGTDILVSSHGAQMTNMFFMDKNSSVMEFFPKGWLELAGVGQYVFRWMADGSGMQHQGSWNDPGGERCPESNKSKCFPFYKDRKIGHDKAFFTNWTASVLKEMRDYKLAVASRSSQALPISSACACS